MSFECRGKILTEYSERCMGCRLGAWCVKKAWQRILPVYREAK